MRTCSDRIPITMLYSSKLENNSQCTRPSFVHAMVVASQCPTVVKIMLIRFDNAAETIVQLYDCSIATTMEPRDGVKYNDGVPRAQCACNREGYFFFRGRFVVFLGPGSMLTAFLLLCFSACLLFAFLPFAFLAFLPFMLLCFSAFPASSFLLLCFPCFSAFLLLCFCAFLLLLFYLFLFFSHVFCCSTSCSTASLLPVFTTCSFFSFLLLYSLLFVS